MYKARREFEEKDSVSPAMTHRITNPHQYHVVKSRLMKARFTGARFAFTVGRRDTASSFSAAVR